MTAIRFSIGRNSRIAGFVGNAERDAIAILRKHVVKPSEQTLTELQWDEFEKIDLVTLARFDGAKTENLTWPEYGATLEIRSALFALKAASECTKALETWGLAADDAYKAGYGDCHVLAAQQLGDSMLRIARAVANMATVRAWAIGMAAITGPLARVDPDREKLINDRIREELPTWNQNTAGKLGRELRTSAKNIREHKKKIEPIP